MTTPANIVEVAARRRHRSARRDCAGSSRARAAISRSWASAGSCRCSSSRPATSRARQLTELWQDLAVPLLAIGCLLLAWGMLAPRIETSLGTVPTPARCGREARNLVAEHHAEREQADRVLRAPGRRATPRSSPTTRTPTRRSAQYTGKPTYIDQIFTSLKTVFTGFVLATLIAVPLGILAGLSKTVNAAVNPFIQIFKPVSPLAWLPIVTMIVSALYVSDDPMFDEVVRELGDHGDAVLAVARR